MKIFFIFFIILFVQIFIFIIIAKYYHNKKQKDINSVMAKFISDASGETSGDLPRRVIENSLSIMAIIKNIGIFIFLIAFFSIIGLVVFGNSLNIPEALHEKLIIISAVIFGIMCVTGLICGFSYGMFQKSKINRTLKRFAEENGLKFDPYTVSARGNYKGFDFELFVYEEKISSGEDVSICYHTVITIKHDGLKEYNFSVKSKKNISMSFLEPLKRCDTCEEFFYSLFDITGGKGKEIITHDIQAFILKNKDIIKGVDVLFGKINYETYNIISHSSDLKFISDFMCEIGNRMLRLKR